ncbi:aminoglycoside phosphotransferase family protein [Microbacterium sp. CFBP9034]|uniref:aminoglycoside phosphotransferase family protein n=1 Tax=Microbacterium sp. CFBP9034 TaxID=3096540 RepID=UPI002A6A826C|nr:aminoglycoside phosphotransferase family protein [Microbacterium sp. CFBP9034]MDY0909351.1 aminoglycoside phosphotransferase family protein [Microbacterium sp. CFBP9034]
MASIEHCMVSFALCTPEGVPLGSTAQVRMRRAPGWSDTRPLVALARRAWALELTVLRLIDAVKNEGVWHLRYGAEADSASAVRAVALAPADPGDFVDEQLRQPWARPGGPARQLEWAIEALATAGVPLTGEPEQVRSWNLSSLWRLPHARGAAWLKAVPSFFAHEGAVLEGLRGFDVPRLLDRTDGICLLDEIPGEDLYGAGGAVAMRMIDLLVGIQRATAADEAFAAVRGLLPDWRLPALAAGAAHTLESSAEDLTAAERRAIERLIDGLDAGAGRLEDCGLPDGLVHGDFHPGNVRGTPARMTLLDWGDSGMGHPLLDVAAFTERMPEADAEPVIDHWLAAWQDAVPGSDPARALMLIGPVAALRQAVIYQGFLDRIEPDEHVYHARDPSEWLRRTAMAVEQASGSH